MESELLRKNYKALVKRPDGSDTVREVELTQLESAALVKFVHGLNVTENQRDCISLRLIQEQVHVQVTTSEIGSNSTLKFRR